MFYAKERLQEDSIAQWEHTVLPTNRSIPRHLQKIFRLNILDCTQASLVVYCQV